jgi:hypothetical protein
LRPSPIGSEHRVDDDVFEAVAVPLCLSQNTFLDEAQTLNRGRSLFSADVFGE